MFKVGLKPCVLLSLLTMLPLAGCGNEKQKYYAVQHEKMLWWMISAYQTKNNNQYPPDLNAVAPFLADAAKNMPAEFADHLDFAAIMKNPYTGADPGYEYVKPTLTGDSSQNPMIYQIKDGKRDETLAKTYIDGSSR